MSVKVEEKLFQNRYLVDEGHPHVCVTEGKEATPALKAIISCCPAGCWGLTEDGKVEPTLDGCLECGTCRILTAQDGDLNWNYPRGGFGIAYKFG